MLFSDKRYARIGQAAVIIWTAFFLASCGLTERITTNRTVQVDTVRHEVPRQGHLYERLFQSADSLLFEDERLKISIDRIEVPDSVSDSAAAERQLPDDVELSDLNGDVADWYRIRAEVKPETVRVKVPQKTITETKTQTKFVKQTPDLVKYLIGGLVAMILIMAVAWRIKS